MNNIVVAGAGPVGLMLAGELKLAGANPVILERRSEPSELPRANGLGGRVVDLLEYRGLLERLGDPFPVPSWRFGPVPVTLDRPFRVLLIQQPELERRLTAWVTELGVEIRRGHEVTGFTQDASGVTVHGTEEMRADYLVGCDGGRSTVRELAGIGFPGDTGSELLRMGHFKVEDAPPTSDWVRTPRGAVIVTSLQPGVAIIGVREEASVDMDMPLTVAELKDAYLRVSGSPLECGEPIWLSRTVSQARLAERYREGRVFLAGDAAHLFPAGGSALNVGLLDAVNLAWKLAGERFLDTYHDERHPVGVRTLAQTRLQELLNGVVDGDVRALATSLLQYGEPSGELSELLYSADSAFGRFHPVSPASGRSGRAVLVTSDPSLAGPYDVDVVEAPGDAVLVRPDGIVAWEGPAAEAGAALERWCVRTASASGRTARPC